MDDETRAAYRRIDSMHSDISESVLLNIRKDIAQSPRQTIAGRRE